MKRFLSIVAVFAAFLFAGTKASAQIGHFGVIGGLTFSKANVSEIKNLNYTGFHAGVAYQLDLPLGFSIQPELVYQQRGAKYNDPAKNMSVGFIELPVNIQWGPDLVLFRPYLMLSPYVGYAVMNRRYDPVNTNVLLKNQWDGVNRFEYGVGLGIGVEIWKFQLSGKYCWSLGNVFDRKIENLFDDAKFGGFQLSLAILF